MAKCNSFGAADIEKIIGYKFKDKLILQTAFTHSSYANEHKAKSNERLEFLGDSILGFVVTKKLYSDYALSEGELTKFRQKLVSEEPLAFVIDELGLSKFILKGKGESKSKVDSRAIKADLFEAIAGAIFLDGGLEVAECWILKNLQSVFASYTDKSDFDDPKTKLQEKLKNAKIVYNTTKHDMVGYFIYKSVLKINGIVAGTGEGRNKKTAEKQAALKALENITKE